METSKEKLIGISETPSQTYLNIWNKVLECQKCKIAKDIQKKVFYRGTSQKPEILFVGEAPGRSEDKQGVPFVGDAGNRLNEAIEHAGIINYGITNIIKCRPPRNRSPKLHEIRNCMPFLIRQVNCFKPKFIVALGRYAVGALQNNWNFSLARIHGKMFYSDIVERYFLATYHPAAQIYAPDLRVKFFEDLRKAATMVKSCKSAMFI